MYMENLQEKEVASQLETEKTQPTLLVNNLSVLIRDRFLVKNVSLTLDKGEIIGLIGQKQSGKTSLIKAVSGSLPIMPGQVFLQGKDIYLNKKALAKVSTCFDPPVFFKYQTVYENLKYLTSLTEGCNKNKITEILKQFNLESKLNVKVLNLSYFEKKLMGLALGLITKPILLLLDEPFLNMPENQLKLVKNTIAKIKAQGTSIIITSATLENIEDECDKFLFMENREIVKQMTRKECLGFKALETFAYVRVKYPHFAGKLIMQNFDLKVKILDKRVLFEADEEETAQIVRLISKNNIPLYGAGFLSKKADKIFASLAPYFKEEEA